MQKWRLTALLVFSAAIASGRALGAQETQTDSARVAAAAAARRMVFLRAQRMVNDGNGAEGRALLDSLLNETEPRTPVEAEILFWRATIAESWEQAERDYLRVMLQHEGSPRAAFAMLRLAQGELARGDREAALRYLERLANEAPESPLRAEAALWQGRILLDRNQRAQGCAVLRGGRARVAAGSLELENQYEYLLRGCPAAPDSAVVAATPAAPAPTTPARPTPASTSQTAPVNASVSAPANAAPQNPAPATPTTPSQNTPAPTRPAQSAPAPSPSTPAPASSTPAASTPAPAVPAAPSAEMVWSVQIAAWPTLEDAQRFVNEMRPKGYDVRIDGTEAPFRVRFGRYATREAAAAAMAAYRQKERANAFLVQVPR